MVSHYLFFLKIPLPPVNFLGGKPNFGFIVLPGFLGFGLNCGGFKGPFDPGGLLPGGLGFKGPFGPVFGFLSGFGIGGRGVGRGLLFGGLGLNTIIFCLFSSYF
tara:strand:+ start:22 stop:333 length:312 start_codon:yes stop_codon:yes gene_type:complete